jgi:hypothetical protein
VRVHRYLQDAVCDVIKIGGLSAYDPWADFSWSHTSEFPLIIVDVAVDGEVSELQAEELASIHRHHSEHKGPWLATNVAGS